jgi:hypothetical protein
MQLAAALSTAVPRGAPRVTHAAAGGSSCKPCAQELKMRDGDHEAPLEATDLTLRAGADGATMRVHAGLLAFNSRVLGEAMRATGGVPPKEGVLTLPGKRAEQLQLLVAWLYRCEDLSQARRSGARLMQLRIACATTAGHSHRDMSLHAASRICWLAPDARACAHTLRELVTPCGVRRTTSRRCAAWRANTTLLQC